ncbi:hypothetical protein TRICI_003132 [Trichomonascus ciferrii]|uniref:AAA+ ATPase domain-containing protein n=1 Tax=Trichomonascus ciferrii TaxID=44093 RepID=A0A642V4N0_9ASCO|nr:hypothetical protein TRICI_003132 [Trichomonascus ciferrii]
MGPKANLNTPPSKAKKPPSSSSGKERAGSTDSPAASKNSSVANGVKPSFIIRPSTSTSNETAMKVYLPLETVRGLGFAAGEWVVVAKRGERGVVGVITPNGSPMKEDTVELSEKLRKLLGALLGDRVCLSKFTGKREAAMKVAIGCKDPNVVSEHESEVTNVLANLTLLCPGIRFKLQSVDGELQLNNVEGMPKLDKLSLEDNVDEVDSNLISPVFIYNKKPELVLLDTYTTKYDIPKPVGYFSIGGLHKQISLLRSKIELPLHQPSTFRRFNMSPDRGFLLHGPPGTGKTMLLRAVANETNAHVLTINGPSIVSKYLGETEAALRNIFEEARDYQPSIIFIDEIDALVPKRDSDESGEAESRVVSTLLTLMDGMGSSGRVVVIGATNRPNSIDPALRRPGRFGQEIEIGIPDVSGRLDILQLQLRDIPHQLNESYISSLASRTHGYVGSDLYALCRDAVMRTIQRGIDSNTPLNSMFVTSDDLEKGLVDIRPSAMREIVLETPKVYWTDVGGQEEVKQTLKEAIEWPLSHPEAFIRLGISPPRGILLYGPPGCSKTLVAKALATEAGLNFLAVKGPELFNKFVGESERAVREIFSKARAAAPSIIFFDEIDALSAERGHGEAGGDRVLTSLLNEMDGIESLNDVTILAATNLPTSIDSALMRPGRLDRLVYVGPPDFDARQKILGIQFKKMSIADDVDITWLSQSTEGCSGAEVVSLCQTAGTIAMNEDINIPAVCLRHFQAALAKLKKAITPEMIEYFEDFAKAGHA